MNESEARLRDQMVEIGRSLFNRGLTGGSSGNISVRIEDGWLMSPTGSCLGLLKPDDIARLDEDGALLSGRPPSKEFPLHRSFLSQRPGDRAVIHLHSSYATALSCLSGLDPENVLPPITPYSLMRFGRLALIDYAKPGSEHLAREIKKRAGSYSAMLLANHGPIVSGPSLEKAFFAIEELEETAKVYLILQGRNYRRLTEAQVAELLP